MEGRIKEFMGLLCSLYIAVIFLVLPLYMKEGYWQLGDAKYELFRNATLFCLLITMMAGVPLLIWKIWKVDFKKKTALPQQNERQSLSWIDCFVIAYGVVNILSYLLSDYPSTAWYGYMQWYMGLLSQLLFIWIYFFMSRSYNGSRFCSLAGQAGLFIVVLLGILHKLQMDPLGMRTGWVTDDWEYSHLLSTLGNINWLCGYISVMLAFSLVGFLYSQNRIESIFLYITSLLAIILLCIQSGRGGLLIIGAATFGMFLLGIRKLQGLRRVLLLGIGTAAVLFLLAVIFNRQDWASFPVEDQWSRYLVAWWGWPIVLLVLLFLYILTFRIEYSRVRIISFFTFGAACLFTLGVVIIAMIREGTLDDSWRYGREGLWILAIKAFREGDFWQKLLGVGPDCYAEYIYATFPVQDYLKPKYPFQNVVFTNAHNEWLNQLVNTGILGLVSYVGIFATAIPRYLREAKKDVFLYVGVLASVFYAVYATVSFQQVTSTPFLFMTLGMCESICRAKCVKRYKDAK